MVKIASYVFFDTETTGLPHQENNKTKIIELSFVAALRKDLEKAVTGTKPFVSKLTLMLNPQRKISAQSTILTGLTNEMLQNAPILKEKSETILSFLKELPKPVCLVAHNGNIFDYKILLAELVDINILLPRDLLCVDSLVGFRKIHKEKYPEIKMNSLQKSRECESLQLNSSTEDWPDLNISSEDWNDIDILCSSFSVVDPFDTSKSLGNSQSHNYKVKKRSKYNEKNSFKLTELYKRLLNKEATNAHRAEDDCMMLLECVVAAKEFLIWADKYCKSIHDIQPLVR